MKGIPIFANEQCAFDPIQTSKSLTPELSRVAKRRRLGRIVTRHAFQLPRAQALAVVRRARRSA